jgi:molybdate transport system substrate-binding protein
VSPVTSSARAKARGRPLAFLVLVPAVVVFAACGGNPSKTTGSGGRTTITVLAAASLRAVFADAAERFSTRNPGVDVRFSFAGTDALVTQIEQGAPADVFAGASMKYADRLASDGLIKTAKSFATNSLVIIVPASNLAHVSSPADLARPGIKLVIAAETVPVGSYTRTELKNLDASLGPGFSERVLANVVSNEDSVDGVVSKVRLGEADAGFVYVTDARSAGADVMAIELPESAQAVATYPIAVLKGSAHALQAAAFVVFILSSDGQALLRQAGFAPPPAG